MQCTVMLGQVSGRLSISRASVNSDQLSSSISSARVSACVGSVCTSVAVRSRGSGRDEKRERG